MLSTLITNRNYQNFDEDDGFFSAPWQQQQQQQPPQSQPQQAAFYSPPLQPVGTTTDSGSKPDPYASLSELLGQTSLSEATAPSPSYQNTIAPAAHLHTQPAFSQPTFDAAQQLPSPSNGSFSAPPAPLPSVFDASDIYSQTQASAQPAWMQPQQAPIAAFYGSQPGYATQDPYYPQYQQQQHYQPQPQQQQQIQDPLDGFFIRNLDTGEMVPLSAADNLPESRKLLPPERLAGKNASSNQGQYRSDGVSFDFTSDATSTSDPLTVNYAPFYVAEERVEELLKKWLGSLWFAPAKLKERALLNDVHRTYLPFWLFNATTNCPFSAKVCKLVEDIVNGKKIVTEHWRDVSGTHVCQYSNIMISAASDKKDNATAKQFKQKDWDLSKVVYRDGLPAPTPPAVEAGVVQKMLSIKIPDFLRSAPTAPPPVSVELMPHSDWIHLWQKYENSRLKKKERASAKNQCLVQQKADKLKELHLRINYSYFDKRLIFLPVIRCSYVHEGTTYRAYVNGLNGKIVGERPLGLGKMAELGEAVAASFKK